MYNMDIFIFGFKLNLEILILIGIVYLILVVHTLAGCCKYSLTEGLDTLVNSDNINHPFVAKNKLLNSNTNMLTQASSGPKIGAGGALVAKKAKERDGKTGGKEGFVGANTNFGQSSPYDLTNDAMIDTSAWSKPNMTVVAGQPLSQGVKDFLARKPQQVPLPEGEKFMFANTPFKPECCPNTYSNSQGCACMTGPQYNYLILRGGNNTPYSEF